MMRFLFGMILISTLLRAQLVEKGSVAPSKSNYSARIERQVSDHSETGKTDSSPDLIEIAKIPKEFVGAVIDKKSERIVFTFRGTWVTAPKIQGGSSSITYSAFATRLQDFLNPSGNDRFLYGFNFGQKNGQLIIRTFKWVQGFSEDDDSSVVQEDEGYGSKKGDTYYFDLENQLVVFRSTKGSVWKPDSVRLIRWEGRDFETELTPKHPNGEYGDWDNANQWVPTWACGSYLVLSDGFLSKIYFRFFSGSLTYVIPSIATSDGAVAYGQTSHCSADMVKPGGFEAMARIWDSGLYLSDGNIGESAWSNPFQTMFKFNRNGDLASISTHGKISDSKSLTSDLIGDCAPVSLPENVVTEVVDRSQELGWVNSGGRFSLKRILLSAFQDTKLIAPNPALSVQPNDWKDSPAQMFNQESIKRWKVGCSYWSRESETAGAQMILPNLAEHPRSIKPAPLGRIASASDLKQPATPLSQPTSETPDAGASAGSRELPTSKGAYVLIDTKWVQLPRNNGKITQSSGTMFMSLGSSAYSAAKLAELVFDGHDPAPMVSGNDFTIAYVGVDAAACEAFKRQHPDLQNYPLVEVARTRTTGNGKRIADLVRVSPGIAGFGNHRCPASINQPNPSSILLKASILQPGTYAVMAGNGELFEVNIRP